MPISEVCELLDLPEPTPRAWLKPDCWLLGGSVLHWLRGLEREGRKPHDYDVFFPSLDSCNRAVSEYLSSGFTFLCFSLLGRSCPFCGEESDRGLEPWTATALESVPVPKLRCRACEAAGSYGEWGGRLPLIQERTARSGMTSLDLLSPTGSVFQLVTLAFEPSIQQTMDSFDFSVCQFGIDDTNLYFGLHAWTDLLQGRLRLEGSRLRKQNYMRMRKYMQRGFRPYADSLANVLMGALLRRLLGIGIRQTAG